METEAGKITTFSTSGIFLTCSSDHCNIIIEQMIFTDRMVKL